MVRRAHRLAVGHRLEYGLHTPALVGLDNVGPKLIADPQCVANELEAFDIKIGSGQIALVRALVHDPERHVAIWIMKKDRFEALEGPFAPIDPIVVEVEHGIGTVGLGAKSVVGEDPERTIVHPLDAGMSLQRLAAK